MSRRKPGIVSVLGIPPILGVFLPALPKLLGPDQPEVVRRRLFPDPTDDPEAVAEWRRNQHPELFALLADSRQIVERDLATLKAGRERGTKRLDIPAGHVNAWISALNAARLALGAIHDVTASDMEAESTLPHDRRGVAVLQIELYGWLQWVLIDASPLPG